MNSRAIICLAMLAASACSKPKPAQISFQKKEDIFTVAKGKQHVSTFKFENTGQDTLRLIGVDATCGCTTVDFDSLGIAPGSTSEIKVTYDSNIDTTSEVQKIVLVESNTIPKLTTLYLMGKIK
ncbi:DUF1573 domain-containing protein [Dyadobacter chenwenxiniae]|uniref:DUF1573 domain-containing protein n=1 Tax=Dyadobacter chenwenxiniae TaxID=2906456 RepID=A0A9X1TKL8_9BACT|nr:DUF1573 domain-containing protein [Dyadobacter chenwenxiniae]MCF0061348.1 DUF1573 domain-containing protein [Dyadobacter chenwenxiniae]UON81170.1 DUF1573 domain-containing protein [Dyadobacter chenwenxiniae]